MNIEKWLEKNTSSLKGKTVAVTGTTGGLGRELCRYLAGLGASLILLDRSHERSDAFRQELEDQFGILAECITVDLENFSSVKHASAELCSRPIDIFIHNAGAYSIPRRVTAEGFDNVFLINFVSPYYMIRSVLPILHARGGRVIAVGSIAHRYSRTDPNDIDFSTRRRASLVYGNAKRYLMFSLYSICASKGVSLAVTHPGISFTGITAHYPRLIFAIIKHPMKLIFMKPRRACLSILRGAFEGCGKNEWIGPCFFDIWGMPKKKHLRSVCDREAEYISDIAEKIYANILK